MNKAYEKPEMDVMVFASDDVITTSGGFEGYGPDTDGSYDFGQRT